MDGIRIIGKIDLSEYSFTNKGLTYNKCDNCGDLIHPSIPLDTIRVFKPKEGTWHDKYVCSVCSHIFSEYNKGTNVMSLDASELHREHYQGELTCC